MKYNQKKAAIRWSGGNYGEYTIVEEYERWWVLDSFTGEINYRAGEVYVDTESVEILEEEE